MRQKFYTISLILAFAIFSTHWLNAQDGVIPLPFHETFDTEEAVNNWTILDNNGGSTWKYFRSNVAYLVDLDNQGDDYLISPRFQLDSTKVYEFAFEATIPSTSYLPESFKVLLFDQVSNTTVLEDYPEYYDSENELKQLFVTVPEDGIYQFGFFEYSQADMFRLMIDNVSVLVAGNVAAPGYITDAIVVPANNGVLADTIRFNAPKQSFGGKDLEIITHIEIYRNNDDTEPIVSFDDQTPGSFIEWIDTNPVNGENTYQIYAINNSGSSPVTNISAYVGVDIPAAPFTAVLSKKEGKAVIDWEAPTTGINYGYINTEALTYQIIRNDGEEIASDITTTTFTDSSVVNEGDQHLLYYTIYASSSAGKSEGVTTNNVILGNAYSAPYAESFAEGEFDNGAWLSFWLEGADDAAWTILSEDGETGAEAQDGDNGFMSFNSYDVAADSKSRLTSPLIDISTLSNPTLGFWMFDFKDKLSETPSQDRLQVQVSVNEGEYINVGDELTFTVEGKGWTYYEISLLAYKNSTSISIGFVGISDYGFNVSVDNISIFNTAMHDLLMQSLNGLKRISVGEDAKYNVLVKNKGAEVEAAYSVEFYNGTTLVESKSGDSIKAGMELNYVYTIKPTLNDITTEDNSYAYFARIVFEADEVKENNMSDTLLVTVRKPEYPAPEQLDAEVKSKFVALNWLAQEERPQAITDTITEDFESYEAFSISEVGDWTFLDQDKDSTLNTPKLESYLNKGVPQAYLVFNTDSLGVTQEWEFEPKSGTQYLVCAASNTVNNNDWLISPILSMKEQTISLWAKEPTDLYGSEKFVVWYSTTDKHIDSFIKLSEGEYVEARTIWQQYFYTLPEGTRYFAIQCVSENQLYLQIDDIFFEKADSDPEVLSLEGYNIYRNDTLIVTVPASTTTYSDVRELDGEYKYKVSAVYDKGESVYSNEVSVSVDNGTSISMLESVIKVYALAGTVCVENALNKDITIISVDGKVLSKKAGEEISIINCNRGIYLVKVGNEVKKVYVP